QPGPRALHYQQCAGTPPGAIGAFATGMGSTDAALILATGKTWLKVPETLRIELEGALCGGVSSKDVVLTLAKDLGADGATYMAIEIGGPGLSGLSTDARFTVCNMGVEMGAKACIMEVDNTAAEWVSRRCHTDYKIYAPDPDARYNKRLRYDLSRITPQVACPHTVDNVMPVDQVGKVPIAQGVIGTCTNGRLEDLQIAANILRGKKVAPGVRLIVVPASRAILLEATNAGIIETLLSAGALVLPPGCGPCVGGHGGIPADGENVISTANRNFKGRMGNAKANIYLASPATVAASMVEGSIVNPRSFMEV
ncbi:MAG: aconitase/3-isopropylmalate dehydratase large subunit family protein, partial [Firmicutes bacterium]|nr:aconitase/3-isopropylmalate dehydratase large subunit family protein [Bacillota bacterium]